MSQSNNLSHAFGGPHTELKLDAVERYLKMFTKALSTQDFNLWYIDAFTGSRMREDTVTAGGIFESEPIYETRTENPGSSIRALDVEPGFHNYVFIEKDLRRFNDLQILKEQYPRKRIDTKNGDANSMLREIFETPPWTNQTAGNGRHKAIVFLDPYGMQVKWETLEILARSAVDVWYLFPLMGVTRQLAKTFINIDRHKSMSLNEIFGNTEWESDLYSIENSQGNLFDEFENNAKRHADQKAIEKYSKDRLKTLFRYVSEPLPLLTDGGAKLYSLFCMSNGNDKAVKLIRKLSNEVINFNVSIIFK
jgi:three-Cys-motif partner protein